MDECSSSAFIPVRTPPILKVTVELNPSLEVMVIVAVVELILGWVSTIVLGLTVIVKSGDAFRGVDNINAPTEEISMTTIKIAIRIVLETALRLLISLLPVIETPIV